jgi:hypothetical protein
MISPPNEPVKAGEHERGALAALRRRLLEACPVIHFDLAGRWRDSFA